MSVIWDLRIRECSKLIMAIESEFRRAPATTPWSRKLRVYSVKGDTPTVL